MRLLGAACIGVSLFVVAQFSWLQYPQNERASEAFVAKDVIADILPPPMYLIEMRLVLSQAVKGAHASNGASHGQR